MKTFTSALLGALLACGGTQGTDPDDMSADEHEAHAGAHDREAEGHEGRDESSGSTPVVAGSPAFTQYGVDVYSPVGAHTSTGEQHHAIAEEHRQAAAELRAFEEQECGGFPAEIRAVCPLLGQLESVEDVDGGVRLTFKEGVNVDAAHSHVRCHNAFARARGRDGMDHCPMYVDGVRVERSEDGATLLVAEGDAVDQVRETARAHVDSE